MWNCLFLYLALMMNALLVTEMVESMKRVAALDKELTVEERNLLSVAYKNVIGARRASWRIVSSIEQKEESKEPQNTPKLKQVKEYREQVLFYSLAYYRSRYEPAVGHLPLAL